MAHPIHNFPSSSPRQSSSRTITGPSAAVLAFLATISVASPTVHGRPLAYQPPPDFLCPQLSSDCLPTKSQLPSPSATPPIPRDHVSPPTPTPSAHHRRDVSRPFVPAKYEQGQDGRWRQSNSWSLYGSAYCDEFQCPTSTASLPVVDDQVATSQSAPTSIAPVDFSMASQLPPGWPSKPTANHVLTAVILVMSLALAAIICGFMVGCIMWRKKRREHARAQQDLEQKRPVFYDDSDNESEGLKRVRSQQRSWSKASARWRANIRISARRRRAQRSLATRESPNSSTTSLHTTSSSSSVSRRHTVSASSEILGLPPHPEEHETTEASRPTAPATASLPPSSPQPLPAHPPAYRTDSGRMSQERFSAISDASGARPYVTHLSTSSEREEARPSYLPSDVAHVATDDKGLLARMATMASAPPAESTSTFMPAALGTSSAAIYPSVPVLDEFEDELHFDDLPSPEPGFEDASSEHSDSLMAQLPAPSYSHDPSHTPFPLPPAKSRLAAPLFYEYPSSFEEDVIGTEPPCGPSAPPFEVAAVAPSAPPLDLGDVGVDDGGLVPSAPPAAEDDAYAVYPDEEARVHTGVVAASLGGEETSSITTPSGRVAYGHRTPSGRNPPEYLP